MRMLTDEWSMGEEAVVQEGRVTGRESTTFAWGFKNSIGPELSQTQPFSPSLDCVKLNLEENPKADWVHARYKCVAQKLQPVPLLDGRQPDAGLDRRGSALSQAIPVPISCEEWFVPKFSNRAKGGRLTREGLRELWIGNLSSPKEKHSLLDMQWNREYSLSGTWEELETISKEVEPPHHIRVESGHIGWKDCVFHIPKNIIPMENELIEERVRQDQIEPICGPDRNAHFQV
jgi:hypothetical protein